MLFFNGLRVVSNRIKIIICWVVERLSNRERDKVKRAVLIKNFG
jgi:hypothetical protein